MNLTPKQQEIVDGINTNLYVNAGPGSGKSTSLAAACVKILENKNNRVILITFTNKSAKDIIAKCSSADKTRIEGGTFHSLAYKYLRENGIKPSICDEYKKRVIIKKLFDCKKDNEKFDKIYTLISNYKSEWPKSNNSNVIKYNSELEKYGLIDFDDIIYSGIDLFNNPNSLFPSVTHILVDELQDTSSPQLELLKCMYRKFNAVIIGVGDIDQSLYEFRGAKPENVNIFIKDFNCKLVNMGDNFRSLPKIVKESSNLIKNNKKRIYKDLIPKRTGEAVINIYESLNYNQEITNIVNKCKQNSTSKIGILYRNRTYKNFIEYELLKNDIKYTVNDSTEISDRTAVKVIVSIFKLASGQFDVYDLYQSSKALKSLGIGTVKKIENEAKDKSIRDVVTSKFVKKVPKTLSSIKKLWESYSINKEKKLTVFYEFLKSELLNKSFQINKDIDKFITDISSNYVISVESILDLANELGLDNKKEHIDETANVELSTVHGAKGGEWDVVILPFTEMYCDDKFDDYDEEAERRLFYVAITRAKNKLYMSYTGSKPKFIKEMK